MPLCFWARFPVNEFCWESDLVSAGFIIIQQVFHDLDAGPAHLLGFNMYAGQSRVGKFCRGRVVKGNQTDLFWDFDPGFFKGLQGAPMAMASLAAIKASGKNPDLSASLMAS